MGNLAPRYLGDGRVRQALNSARGARLDLGSIPSVSTTCGSVSLMSNSSLLDEVKFLTVREVAEALRVSKMTVYRLVGSGELESKRIGRSFRIPEKALSRYLKAA